MEEARRLVNASVSLSERAEAEQCLMLGEPWAVVSPSPEVRGNLGRAGVSLHQAYFGDASLSETVKFTLNPCCNFSIPIPA